MTMRNGERDVSEQYLDDELHIVEALSTVETCDAAFDCNAEVTVRWL